jgi:glycosyltransferase involved in cell wall biosynthesis
MNIFFVTSWFPSRVIPNNGNFVARHARLVARNHAVTVVTIQEDPGLSLGQLELTERAEDGYYVLQVYFGQGSAPVPVKLALRLRAWAKGLRLAKLVSGRPDLLHGHVLLDGGMIAYLWSRWWRKPLVLTEHSSAYHSPGALPGIRGWLGRRACAAAAVVMPVSAHLGRSMRQVNRLAGRYRVVSNVVNTDLFVHVPPPPSAEPFQLLHVSNFVREKNIPGLMEGMLAFQQKTTRQVTLHLAGDGDLAALRQMIGEKENITISGPHTEGEIARLLAGCHAFVLFSDFENQPVVLLEAQCCGRPCVATAVGGVPDIIEPGETGLLVAPRDPAGLTEALRLIEAHYRQYDQLAIRKRALATYGEAAVRHALNEVYAAALAGV